MKLPALGSPEPTNPYRRCLKMSIQAAIEEHLRVGVPGDYLQVLNESHMHAGPATESHFKITAVSPNFDGLSAVKRHQRVYQLLAHELRSGVHALALHLYTPAEWDRKNAAAPRSPDCMGLNH